MYSVFRVIVKYMDLISANGQRGLVGMILLNL